MQVLKETIISHKLLIICALSLKIRDVVALCSERVITQSRSLSLAAY